MSASCFRTLIMSLYLSRVIIELLLALYEFSVKKNKRDSFNMYELGVFANPPTRPYCNQNQNWKWTGAI